MIINSKGDGKKTIDLLEDDSNAYISKKFGKPLGEEILDQYLEDTFAETIGQQITVIIKRVLRDMEQENRGCFTLFLSLLFRLFIFALFMIGLAALPGLLLPLIIFLVIMYLQSEKEVV